MCYQDVSYANCPCGVKFIKLHAVEYCDRGRALVLAGREHELRVMPVPPTNDEDSPIEADCPACISERGE